MIKAILGFALGRRAVVILGLFVFVSAGLIAYSKLNIEAYPNPAPVILEITAQAAGLSAEEIEKYYTTPMEIGLYSTPGIDNIRSTSFYGLSFVRVTFKYGVDYYFAYTQAALSLQQNVQLPGNQVAQIQQSSLVGEVYRYQVVGPPHFGLTNLRTVQDWIAIRRLSTIPGVVAVNSWGGTTKEFDVEADLVKLQAFSITMPQLLTALGNSNIKVPQPISHSMNSPISVWIQARPTSITRLRSAIFRSSSACAAVTWEVRSPRRKRELPRTSNYLPDIGSCGRASFRICRRQKRAWQCSCR
jgi:cobalt-zinc-cadmium resistance protein CzcA